MKWLLYIWLSVGPANDAAAYDYRLSFSNHESGQPTAERKCMIAKSEWETRLKAAGVRAHAICIPDYQLLDGYGAALHWELLSDSKRLLRLKEAEEKSE